MNTSDKNSLLPSKFDDLSIVNKLLIVVAQIVFHILWLFPMCLLWLMPAGDNLPQVSARLVAFSLSVLILNLLLRYKRRIFHRLFGGIVSNQFLDRYDHRFDGATGIKDALESNLHLCIVAILMLSVITGVIDFSNPWFEPKVSTGKASWINDVLRWLRANPNTVLAMAWLWFVGSLGSLGFRIYCGWIYSSQHSTSDAA